MLTFRRGHEVGALAHNLFPGGVDVSSITRNAADALQETQKLLSAGTKVIYEATFMYQRTLIMVDILVRDTEGFYAYEVKSSLKVSENYVRDACLQYFVLRNSMPDFHDIFLVTLNPDYELDGELDVKKLFRRRSLREKAEQHLGYFETRIAAANQVLTENQMPARDIGRQCFKPYQCDFYGHCWKQVSVPGSIFDLPLQNKEKLFELYEQGHRTIDAVKTDDLPVARDRKVKDAFTSGQPVVDAGAITKFLSSVQAPWLVLDMEVWNPAIPQLQGTRCFEQLPFLVCFYDGSEFSHFMTDYERDEREEFARALIEHTKGSASIVVYDKNLESGVITALQKRFPHLDKELGEVKSKMLDVFEVFLNLHYYAPQFRNNFSLKSVSAVLLPDLNYEGISSGMEAMSVFEKYRKPADLFEKETVRENLVDYCNTDCEATYKLVRWLAERF